MIFYKIPAIALLLCLLTVNIAAEELSSGDITEGINRFTFDFMREMEAENIFFSPYSISSALAITYAGAKEITEREMAKVLYYSENQEAFHQAFNQLNSALNERDQEGIVLNIANRLWVEETMDLLEEYLNVTDRYYDAGLKKLNFLFETEESRQTINRWVEEQTEEKIQNLLELGSVSPLTRLVITNAIYFLGGWDEVFSEERTRDRDFYLTADQTITAPFMERTGSYNYYSGDQCQAVEIPYHNNELAMLVILPQEHINLHSFIEMMDYEQYETIVESLSSHQVEIQMPKFILETKYSLKDFFVDLGMKEAFTPEADFSGMALQPEDLFIDEIFHQAFIEVDEKGTEAAAATAVAMRTTAIEPGLSFFRANRPFLFLIRDKITGTILFSGTLYNPQ